ncbi:hypothetical protein [Halorussus marinus]|uniref:hypothetical protein n=1 Tax=Halorussus marinus TaxID=2505976 RepID=UPI00106F01F7|nr:hypothetical protein [Halorussus marinus]
MSDDSRSTADRLDAFAAASEFDVDRHGEEVAVRVVVDADGFRTDLSDLFDAAAEHGLVAFDGWVGGQGVASIRFKPAEGADGVTLDADAN